MICRDNTGALDDHGMELNGLYCLDDNTALNLFLFDDFMTSGI